jgi:1,2-phenylacetyl-CoA epoxidase catalytic subunit
LGEFYPCVKKKHKKGETMKRQEIYDKINDWYNIVANLLEVGLSKNFLSYDKYVILNQARRELYRKYHKALMLSNDNELETNLSTIINLNLEDMELETLLQGSMIIN